MDAKEFGNYLRALREERDLSINQLALYSGVSNAQISRIENGLRKPPKPETLRKLAQALKIDYDELMAAAGHVNEDAQPAPEWATTKDKRDFKKMLEEDAPVMFDGVPISDEDKEKIKRVMEAMFWDAKEKNKKTYGRKKKGD
ncbi:helix-turn-helix domain-containing protein [Paenibacillus sp. URB8-2]|uniref:helix-turn-helix domain-containing protein n=1 Tax=Paenibacillus sp. URB8-2 TaxID=2741301 RepID=UPI0015C0CCF7|nr:helix-turn-helix domain-containing protein [Paenibacillus sp. URB8-2]BCG57453.1 hypothetical protein PUR_08780 [Paenibacillus sp. URB8-2]